MLVLIFVLARLRRHAVAVRHDLAAAVSIESSAADAITQMASSFLFTGMTVHVKDDPDPAG
jgi:hypothetical protein